MDQPVTQLLLLEQTRMVSSFSFQVILFVDVMSRIDLFMVSFSSIYRELIDELGMDGQDHGQSFRLALFINLHFSQCKPVICYLST